MISTPSPMTSISANCLSKLKKCMTAFFKKRQKKKISSDCCEICCVSFTEAKAVVPLNAFLVREVINILQLNSEEGDKNIGKLYCCEICGNLLTKLIDISKQIEELKSQFVELRNAVAKELLFGSLERSEDELEEWTRQVHSYDFTGYSYTGKTQAPSAKVVEQDEMNDAKLKKMTPIVLLKRLNCNQNKVPVPEEIEMKLEEDFTIEVDKFETESNASLSEETSSLHMDTITTYNIGNNGADLGQEAGGHLGSMFESNTNIIITSTNASDINGMNGIIMEIESTNEETQHSIYNVAEIPSELKNFTTQVSYDLNNVTEEESIADNNSVHSEYNCSSGESSAESDSSINSTSTDSSINSRKTKTNKKSLAARKSTNVKGTTNEESNNIICRHCQQKFPSQNLLRFHISKTHQVCRICHKHFGSRKKLLKHREESHPKNHRGRRESHFIVKYGKCHDCSVQFYSTNEKVIHMAKLHGIFIIEPKISCSHCDEMFNKERLLSYHKLYTHLVGEEKNGISQCDLCLRYLQNTKNLKLHKKSLHYGRREPKEGMKPQNIQCFICLDSPNYLNVEELKVHEESEGHKEKVKSQVKVFCNVCKVNFEGDVEALKVHLVGEDHKRELDSLGEFDRSKFCVPCRKTFDSFEQLKNHTTKDSEHKKVCNEFRENKIPEEESNLPELKCHACPKIFQDKKLLNRHMARYHSTAGHECKTCKEIFGDWNEFELHRRIHLKEGTRNFVCDKCGSQFQYRKYLAQHIKNVHSTQRSFQCEKCAKTFKSESSLYMHVRNVHNLKRTKLDCPHCDRPFGNGTYLRKHLCKEHSEIHLKDKTHYCNICFHNFSTEEELTTHMSGHSIRSIIKCFFCGKQSPSPVHLNMHLRTHTGERPFNCELCESWFKTKGNLTNHINALHQRKKRSTKKKEHQGK